MKLRLMPRTLLRLGVRNVLRVGIYRLGLKSGLSRARRLTAARPEGPFFRRTPARHDLPSPSRAWASEATYFDSRKFPLTGPAPNWMHNPYTSTTVTGAQQPWWRIPDFCPHVGDIKVIWEPSRFGWTISASERAATGDPQGWEQLEGWLSDWCESNPPYLGPNWKCGQEAAIRTMHLAMAALITGNLEAPTPGLADLVDVHLRRIRPTIQYAIGQDNNHGTSEAAALFIGGSLLLHAGRTDGQRYLRLGRNLVENRVARLVATDGSFSQQSMTYHRLFLDTMIMADVWRRRARLPAFSAATQERLAHAARWLFSMVDPETGDAPNLGANDGARLLPLTDTGYRDFRPTVQLAMALFCGERAYTGQGPWNDPFTWLGCDLPSAEATVPAGVQFDQGGYVILRAGEARVLFRYPCFQFRPAQSDALHVDLWLGSVNLLRDAGTFSYGLDLNTMDQFAGAIGHNTVAFDDQNQMPRLGRFLFGAWLQARDVACDTSGGTAQAGYTDWRGNSHRRSLALRGNSLRVTDEISGPFLKAVLRWRLPDGAWRLTDDGVTDGCRRVSISATMSTVRLEIARLDESRLYLDRQPTPVLECEFSTAGEITSEITWT